MKATPISVSMGHWATMSHLSCYTEPLKLWKNLELNQSRTKFHCFSQKDHIFNFKGGQQYCCWNNYSALPGWKLVTITARMINMISMLSILLWDMSCPVNLDLSPCNNHPSSGQKHQNRRNVIALTGVAGFGIDLPAKGPNQCKPCQDHSPEQVWQKPSLWEISTWVHRFLFMHDTHVVNHWFRTGGSVTHLTIQRFFLT